MPTLRSSVLIVAHPNISSVQFGADFADHLIAAAEQAKSKSYPVIVVPSSQIKSDSDLAFFDSINSESPLSQRVIVHDELDAENLRRLINKGHVFKVLSSFEDPTFERSIQEALDEYMLAQQNARLLQVVNEQNESLKKLSLELEDRVEKRQKFLEDTRAKLLSTNHRVEALHRALIAVHRAGSIAEMERLINEALSGALGLISTRIAFQSQGAQMDQLANRGQVSVFAVPLSDARTQSREPLGTIHFVREKERPFSKDENSFLSQVADSVSLAIDRLMKLGQSETLKAQWDATFDAILEPVSLIDENFTLMRTNRAFAEKAGKTPATIIGKKCFDVLFGRNSPCENCRLSTNFRLQPMVTGADKFSTFDVFSQSIQFKPESKTLFVNMYRDVSEQIKLEHQIVESAKMAELGTIGSSIAHELNNPLGGILSFLQLIQMDLKGDETYASDINDMELGARRCRDIVQNLLGFTRKSASYEEPGELDLRDVVHQALKITELQTRAMGIQVQLELPKTPVLMKGQFNYLAQAIRGFLQNAHEGIAARMKTASRFDAEISVRLTQKSNQAIIEIEDNGAGPSERATSLGLTVALQIITDHSGRLENFAQTIGGTKAKISLPT